jgi:predicted ATPase/DNA-binding CsgD family transcriptional regulator/Flp pilus assembly protein TadD
MRVGIWVGIDYNVTMDGRDSATVSPAPSLTEREQEILACMGDGLTNRQIAERLTIALSTVKWYTHQIYSKLGVANREEAIRYGRRLGLLADTARPPHNLPPQPTPFVGREAELAALADFLADPDTQLITITGPGGMGKTRLALATAEAQLNSRQQPHPFAHGVCFVSLASVASTGEIVPTLAGALNFLFFEGDEPKSQLLRFLRAKQMLLVLDNFEHLRAGAGLIEEMRQAAPAVKLLVTSRERLNLQAEQLFPLGGLAVPDVEVVGDGAALERLAGYGAVQLFGQCARRVRPGFSLTADNQAHVVTVCRHVAGMPLGIVLAAAWMGGLTTAEIAAEMSRDWDFLAAEMADAPARQHSLRAAFNHSWRLLSQREQKVFAQLSVFRGSFSRPAAKAVTGAALRDLQALLNKSLIYRTPAGRYQVHELLRQYAAQQLAQTPEEEMGVRDRHSAYYCAFLHERSEDWHTGRQIETIRAVAQEADNIRQGWDWALVQGEWPRLQQAFDSWCWYHQLHTRDKGFDSYCQAIIRKMESLAAGGEALSPDSLRLWVRALAWVAESEDDPDDSSLRLQEAMTLLERPELANQDIRLEKVLALQAQARWLARKDNLEAAQQISEQCLALFEELGAQWTIAEILMNLGSIAWRTGNYDLALKRLGTALAIQQELGDQIRRAETMNRLGQVHRNLGHLDEAEQLHREALDLSQRLDHRQALVARTVNLAHTLLWQGKFAEAEPLARQSMALYQGLGYQDEVSWGHCVLGSNLLYSGQYNQAGRQAAQALSLGLDIDQSESLVPGWLYLVSGQCALVESSYRQAQDAFARSSELFKQGWLNSVGFPLAGLGHVACCQGQLAPARQYLVEALDSALAAKTYMALVYTLPFIAHFLATTGYLERGLELWELARTQPLVTNSKWFADLVGQELEAVATALPPEVAGAARERGRALDLWVTAETLLAELSEGDPVT